MARKTQLNYQNKKKYNALHTCQTLPFYIKIPSKLVEILKREK